MPTYRLGREIGVHADANDNARRVYAYKCCTELPDPDESSSSQSDNSSSSSADVHHPPRNKMHLGREMGVHASVDDEEDVRRVFGYLCCATDTEPESSGASSSSQSVSESSVSEGGTVVPAKVRLGRELGIHDNRLVYGYQPDCCTEGVDCGDCVLPTTLTITFNDALSGCACLDGFSAVMTYSEAAGGWGVIAASPCGCRIKACLTCSAGTYSVRLQFLEDDDTSDPCEFDSSDNNDCWNNTHAATLSTCSPVLLVPGGPIAIDNSACICKTSACFSLLDYTITE